MSLFNLQMFKQISVQNLNSVATDTFQISSQLQGIFNVQTEIIQVEVEINKYKYKYKCKYKRKQK